MSKSVLDVSIIVTFLNESATILELLESLYDQTYPIREVLLIDGGSIDDTVQKIETFARTHQKISFVVKRKIGNRSIGRNMAIKLSSSEVVACTDAGCVPKKDWLEQLVKMYENSGRTVVAGYYAGATATDFQKAVVPYALVMPDKVNEKSFLPATRSLLMEKEVWRKVGGFNEMLSDNEDYDFAKRIQKAGIPIAFARSAVVLWQPRSTIAQFFWMIFRFARGDIQAKIIRPKVVLLFTRYALLVGSFIFFENAINLITALKILLVLLLVYLLWAVMKNIKYVGRAWYWLPVLQIVADVAVISGSVAGIFTRK